MLKHELVYQHDSALLFERVARQPWAMLLDSGQALDPLTGKAGSQYGRYDIIVAQPFITLVTQGNQTAITQNNQVKHSQEDPFLLINHLLNQYPAAKSAAHDKALPFAGGAVGYFAYDLARRIEKLPTNAMPAVAVPEMMIGLYDWAVVVDHREQKSTLVSYGLHAETQQNWPALQALFGEPSGFNQPEKFIQPFEALTSPKNANKFEVKSPISSNLSETQYQRAFNKIKAYIEAGDCYQVNLAQRFSANVAGDSWLAYLKLREISPAPFMAYMNLPLNENECFQVLSNSPERFIQISGNHVETRPIKGTRPRASNAAQDLAYSNALLHSAKDKAENVMIVDLLRNDLSKSCQSVMVTKLFQLQSFANVHHLVSIIVGKLRPNKTAPDVLRACFPGGSITGAPKLRAMQIIEELEPHRRGIYCGSIAYIGFDGNMDSNIAIRTAVCANKHLIFYAGGGIVADSDASKEYAETLDKASNLITIMKFFMRQ